MTSKVDLHAVDVKSVLLTLFSDVTVLLQDKLRDAGCLDHIQPVLTAHVMAMQIGLEPRTRTSVIVGLTTAINNLAVNQENQKHLKVNERVYATCFYLSNHIFKSSVTYNI